MEVNKEAINRGNTKFSGLTASGYHDAICKKMGGVRQEKKQAWVTGHTEFESFGTFHITGNIQEKTGRTESGAQEGELD